MNQKEINRLKHRYYKKSYHELQQYRENLMDSLSTSSSIVYRIRLLDKIIAEKKHSYLKWKATMDRVMRD